MTTIITIIIIIIIIIESLYFQQLFPSNYEQCKIKRSLIFRVPEVNQRSLEYLSSRDNIHQPPAALS
jgi:hypothetical protein